MVLKIISPFFHFQNTQGPPAAPPEVVSPAPPADKKAKREKVSDDFSLAALLPSALSKVKPWSLGSCWGASFWGFERSFD